MFIRITPDQIESDGFKKFGNNLFIFFKGYVIWNERLHRDKEFIPIIKEHYISGNIAKFIHDYNGNFEFAIHQGNDVLIGNDRYGIYPLFYYQTDNEYIITTQWSRLIPYSGKDFRKDSVLEILSFGNVIGNKTLIKNVYELDPASLLMISVRSGRLNFDHKRYWELVYKFKPGKIDHFEREFAGLWKNQIKIYCDFLREHGNCCVQLLSGGMDSRLLAHEFDQAGVHIHAITYGRGENSGEIITARKVVKQLSNCSSHRILFLNNAELEKIIQSKVKYDRITQARNAEKDLYSYRSLSDQCTIRIPGYSGDFTAGSHIKYRMKFWNSKDNIINYILRFKLAPIIKKDLDTNHKHKDLIINSLNETIGSNKEPISSFIQWDLNNRQRRYIIRPEVEENTGPALFLLPFFDYRVLDFFLDLPLEALLNASLYLNSQIKYLFESNPGLIKVKRDNTLPPQLIYNNFFHEYSGKILYLINKYRNRKKLHIMSNWSGEINWQKRIDSWDLPDILNEFHIQTRNVDGSYCIFLLSLSKLKSELSEL